jgi:hypothetical protein
MPSKHAYANARFRTTGRACPPFGDPRAAAVDAGPHCVHPSRGPAGVAAGPDSARRGSTADDGKMLVLQRKPEHETSLRCCRSSSGGAAPAVYCFSATASLSASPERRSGGAGRPPRGRRQKSATLAITEAEYSRGSWAGCQHASRSVRCACLRPGVGPDPRRVDRGPLVVQVCLRA